MSADPLGEPVRGTDDDVLGRLAAIDHRLHQISTPLSTLGTLFSQLEEIRTHLQNADRVAQVGGSIMSAAFRPPVELRGF